MNCSISGKGYIFINWKMTRQVMNFFYWEASISIEEKRILIIDDVVKQIYPIPICHKICQKGLYDPKLVDTWIQNCQRILKLHEGSHQRI